MARDQGSPYWISKALEEHPDATAAEIATAASVARSTAAKVLGGMEKDGSARRTPGGYEGGRRAPDRWSLVGATLEETRELVMAAKRQRLPKGALRPLILDFLGRHSLGAYTPSAIAKELGRSAGAVSNALAKMAAEGSVIEVSARPRGYRHNVHWHGD